MTEQEAIEYLNNHYLVVGHILNPPKKECEHHNSVMDMAIQALEEIEQYRSIGTVEEFKALKEKAEPKKPILRLCGDCQSSECVDCDKHVDRCPSCNGALYVESGKPHECCPNCGQKLDWT